MTGRIIDIERGGDGFAVLDDPQTRSWNFWEQQFASGVWEAATLDTIDRLLADGGDYLDIGAWVGPTVLWAARKAEHVLALEPDPVAAGVLLANVGMNVNNVAIWPAAVTNGIDGSVTLRNRDHWGNSGSTTIEPELYLRHAGPDEPAVDEVEAPAVDIADVLAVAGDDLRLVKIDIEGAEADLLGRLTDVICPMIISLHIPWYRDPLVVADDLYRLGRVDTLDDSDSRFPVYLVTPQ